MENKKKKTFYIYDEELFEEFKIYCVSNKINLYTAVEQAIDLWLSKENQVVIPNASKIVRKKNY